ncbi:MAG: hypothetical protein V7631_218 [Massilia sp.]|jgi:hypothetical protein
MKKLLSAIAATLAARARSRAELVMRKQAEMRICRQEVYSSNAGGWN